MKLLAVDPGVTTGYCFATLHGGATADQINIQLDVKPEQHLDDVDECWDRIEKFDPRYIVCEDFEFRQGKQRTGLVLYSVQLIGIVNLYGAKAENCAVTLQKASTGKGYYTNKVLKDYGVYKPGAAWEHSMDATRHLLHWLTFGSGYQLIEGKQMKDIVKLV